ncbi:ABC transporter substrate-binding protein [Jiangella ureilytica]|uniref:ABC transporter substrate-binding protein n=1 Tax=Jiangella ureilytica TaxID=2530374 RepID=A0A4R4RMN4_9ACTN|nr:ABC transporter substrate-binding protein [Jiangella ureilytica]TDC50319.1 ABC transporter substrate-binding protein [Jiangella ureilytica]
MPKRHHFQVLVIGLVTAVALAGCGGGSSESPAAGEGGDGATGGQSAGPLRMLGVEPTQGFDPSTAFADASRVPMAMMYETLTERDGEGEIVGALAESWEVSDDGTVYTFTLRDGIAFSDGSPITAADVKFSFDRMKTGEALQAQLATLTSVEAVDDTTVTFTLSGPMSTFPALVGRPANAAILSEAAVGADPDYFTMPTVTSGPWTLSEYTPKSQMTFTANEHYFKPPGIATIQVSFNNDPTANAAALESGSADVASVAYSDAERLKSEGTLQIVQSDQLAPLFWGWDRTKAPFDSKDVRQAVAWAVDREGKQEACWFGTGGVTYGNILRPWDPAYEEINTYRADDREDALAEAADLLDAAGWVEPEGGGTRVADGVDGVEDGTPLAFEVPYEGNWPAAECHVQILQQNLQEVGIEVTPSKYDPAAYWGDVSAGTFTMYHGGAGAADSMDLYANWFATGGSLTALTTHLDDPEINAKVTEAQQVDEETSIQIIKELEEWQAEELPMLVVGYQWPQVGMTQRVQNYRPGVDADSYTLVEATLSE